MKTNPTDIQKYGPALCTILKHFATSIPQGCWFIINYNDDEDANTLANFLHICYTELKALLLQIGIMITVGKNTCIRHCAMTNFLQGIKQVEYTKTWLLYDGDSPCDYHLL